MRARFLQLLNVLVFHRLDAMGTMKQQETAAREQAQDTHQRNQRDYRFLRDSGLNLPNLNATLFDGRARNGGRP